MHIVKSWGQCIVQEQLLKRSWALRLVHAVLNQPGNVCTLWKRDFSRSTQQPSVKKMYRNMKYETSYREKKSSFWKNIKWNIITINISNQTRKKKMISLCTTWDWLSSYLNNSSMKKPRLCSNVINQRRCYEGCGSCASGVWRHMHTWMNCTASSTSACGMTHHSRSIPQEEGIVST